jgi:hypothetical protein
VPMLFWLPVIIMSGWWSTFAEPSDHRVDRQSADVLPPADPMT